jgi:hypothetical protein
MTSKIAEGKQKAINPKNPYNADFVVRVVTNIIIWFAIGPGNA